MVKEMGRVFHSRKTNIDEFSTPVDFFVDKWACFGKAMAQVIADDWGNALDNKKNVKIKWFMLYSYFYNALESNPEMERQILGKCEQFYRFLMKILMALDKKIGKPVSFEPISVEPLKEIEAVLSIEDE